MGWIVGRPTVVGLVCVCCLATDGTEAGYCWFGAEGARGKTRPRCNLLLSVSLETNRVVRGREKEGEENKDERRAQGQVRK